MMLKGLDPLLTPDLLWTLAAMGHGDSLAVVDANYPAHALHERVVTLAGVDMASTMTAIASLFPVDTAVEPAVSGMAPDAGPAGPVSSHGVVAEVLSASEGRSVPVAPLARTPFYAQARKAFAVVLIGETSS